MNKTIKIEKLDHQGRGIGRYDGKVVFTTNALPNELVEIDIIKDKKKYIEAETTKILEVSEKRIVPKCPYFNECGGCDLQHITYADEIDYKLDKVKNIFERFTALNNIEIDNITPSEDEFNYRNKVSLKVNNKVGFYKKNSNEIKDIGYCYIANDKINEVINHISKHLDLSNINEIIIKSDGNSTLIYIKADSDEVKVNSLIPYADSIVLKVGNEITNLRGEGVIEYNLGNLKYIIDSESFFQINSKVAKQLYDEVNKVVSKLKKPKVLDLYSGVGSIALYLSSKSESVTGVEINEHAYNMSLDNMQLNNIKNVNFENIDVNEWVSNNELDYDVLIVDPPRKGLEKQLVETIINSKIENIIYISCDPLTLARDLDYLSEFYSVSNIKLYDMFPRTSHVETLVVLNRK